MSKTRLQTLSLSGREDRKSDTSIKVDYNTLDPVVRWDSYENFNLHHQDSIESKTFPITDLKKKKKCRLF